MRGDRISKKVKRRCEDRFAVRTAEKLLNEETRTAFLSLSQINGLPIGSTRSTLLQNINTWFSMIWLNLSNFEGIVIIN